MKERNFIEDNDYAYTVMLPYGIELNVKKSANAWWNDKQKVHDLISAFKLDATIPEACSYAQITVKQYKYFVNQHPTFREAKSGYEANNILRARQTLIQAISSDYKVAFKYLEKKRPGEFGAAKNIEKEEEREDKRRKIKSIIAIQKDTRKILEGK